MCIIKAYFDVFKVFGYSKGNKRPSQGDLFVLADIFLLSIQVQQKKKEPQVKPEVLFKTERVRDCFHTLNLIPFMVYRHIN